MRKGYVALKVPSGLQANSSFNITLWASDGTTTQTETVPVVIQAPCKPHHPAVNTAAAIAKVLLFSVGNLVSFVTNVIELVDS